MGLSIIRTQPTGTAITKFLDASVGLRDPKGRNVPDSPDIVFSMSTYQKIARGVDPAVNDKSADAVDEVGDNILLPINLFFEKLTFGEMQILYDMYKAAKNDILAITKDNRREVQDRLQDRIFKTVQVLDLSNKIIDYCRSDRFVYPDLTDAGKAAHHTADKTFHTDEYAEVTAMSLLSKMMVPIWGEFIKKLDQVGILIAQRNNIAFDLIEPVLEEGAFERIYTKLSNVLATQVSDILDTINKKSMGANAETSFILTHNGINDEMFDTIVMSEIVVKRMATYECFIRMKDNNIPNAMVYINDGIRRTTETKIGAMRKEMNTMPRRKLSDHDTEDNSSILDHASKTSKKPVDDPIFVRVIGEHYEIPRLLEDTQTPEDVYAAATQYYLKNPFDVSPLTQAMVASFVGQRFGGSKCLNYLPPHLYQRLVVILQIFLIKQKMFDLVSLVSSNTLPIPIDGAKSSATLRVETMKKSWGEYQRCHNLFEKYLEKPVVSFNKRQSSRKQEVERIDFVNHIDRMTDWMTRYVHKDNTAPTLWDYADVANRPVYGSDCQFDETVIQNLCQFYLLFHEDKRPF